MRHARALGQLQRQTVVFTLLEAAEVEPTLIAIDLDESDNVHIEFVGSIKVGDAKLNVACARDREGHYLSLINASIFLPRIVKDLDRPGDPSQVGGRGSLTGIDLAVLPSEEQERPDRIDPPMERQHQAQGDPVITPLHEVPQAAAKCGSAAL